MSEDVAPGRYRLFNGGEYEVLLVALDAEMELHVVVYRALHGERGSSTRSLTDFTAHVTRADYDGPGSSRSNTSQ